MELLERIINKIIEWIDEIFKWFGFYSTGYSKIIVLIFAVLAGAEILQSKVNLNLNLGKK